MAWDNLSDFEKGYIAGLIDGEGWIGITKSKRKGSTKPRYSPDLRIRLTHYPTILMLHTIFGGSYQYCVKVPQEHKDQWEWVAGWRQGAEILKNIAPLLKIKKEQAFAYLDYYKYTRKTFRRSQKDIDFQENHYLKMKKLNQRGKVNVG